MLLNCELLQYVVEKRGPGQARHKRVFRIPSLLSSFVSTLAGLKRWLQTLNLEFLPRVIHITTKSLTIPRSTPACHNRWLYDNELTGQIPPELSAMTSLTDLCVRPSPRPPRCPYRSPFTHVVPHCVSQAGVQKLSDRCRAVCVVQCGAFFCLLARLLLLHNLRHERVLVYFEVRRRKLPLRPLSVDLPGRSISRAHPGADASAHPGTNARASPGADGCAGPRADGRTDSRSDDMLPIWNVLVSVVVGFWLSSMCSGLLRC